MGSFSSSTYDVPTIVEETPDGQVPRLPESRVRDGWHGHAIFRKLEYDDRVAEAARANIDYQIDGGLPYSREVMQQAGRGEDANVNFGEAKAEDDAAQIPFIEMGTVSKTLWQINVNHGNYKDNVRWSKIISEEFTKLVREDWDEDYDFQRLRLAQQFTRHGAGFAYFEDELDWRWRADGLGAFKLPRNTESRGTAVSYCICKRSLSVDALYKFIKNEKRAREVGRWNVDAVKTALLNAAVSSGRQVENYAWEDFQKDIKENDCEFGLRAEQVQIYHLWVQEYDEGSHYHGKVSHYIGLQDGVAMVNGEIQKPDQAAQPEGMDGNGFLYAHRCRFPKFQSCIIPFFYAIGTHATVHTIRGQGAQNFVPISVANRALCTTIDTAKASTMILVSAETPGDMENMAYVQVGPFLIYPRMNNKVEPTAMPDVSGRMIPILDRMANMRRQLNPSSIAQPMASGKSKQPETKYGIQAKQNQVGALNSAMLTQWFGPFKRLGKEMYRRVMNPDLQENDPGGREAFAFRARCMKRDVPAEAMRFENVTIEAVRVIGNGSPEQRQYSAEQILEVSDRFDPAGKHAALLDFVASLPAVDMRAAQEYVGPDVPREPIDQQIANLENTAFKLSSTAKVTGEQDHWVHCQVHMELVKEVVDSFNGKTDEQIDGPKLVSILAPALDNMLDHSDYLSKDKTREKQSAEVRKFIQQNSGILQQQETKMLAAQQRQQEQQQGEQPQGGGEEQRAMELHRMKMAQMQQELAMKHELFNQKLALQQQEAHASRSLADMKAAIEMAEQTAALAAREV